MAVRSIIVAAEAIVAIYMKPITLSLVYSACIHGSWFQRDDFQVILTLVRSEIVTSRFSQICRLKSH